MKRTTLNARVQQIAPQRKKRLKVCYGYYRRVKRKHPLINLGGYYLSKFGFEIGDSIDLTIEKGQIVIRKSIE